MRHVYFARQPPFARIKHLFTEENCIWFFINPYLAIYAMLMPGPELFQRTVGGTMTARHTKLAGLLAFALAAFLIALPQQAVASSEATATVDLNNPAPQEVPVTLPDGSNGTLGIEPVLTNDLFTRASYDLGRGNGTWNVYWNTGLLNTGYTIEVKNYNIVRCYDNYTSGLGMLIDSSSLNWGAKWSTQTTRYHEPVFQSSSTRFLKGNISGTRLITIID